MASSWARRVPTALLAATAAAATAAAGRPHAAGQAPKLAAASAPPPPTAAGAGVAPEVPLDAKYEQVELGLEGDSDCPVCTALKKTPCWQPFVHFHKCSEYHKRRGEDIVAPCTKYALALNDCLGANAHLLPPEIANQRWQKDK